VLLLDEPFHGLDAEATAHARRFLYELAKGRTVVHATHELGDVIGLAQGLLMIEGGVANWVTSDHALCRTGTDVTVFPIDVALSVIVDLGATAEVVGPRRVRVAPGHAAHEIIDALVGAGCRVDASNPVFVR
jgi:ABC-type multidrug transport system ATPase subunit